MGTNNSSGLSIGQRAYIRKQHREGMTARALAEKYGVTAAVINSILLAGQ